MTTSTNTNEITEIYSRLISDFEKKFARSIIHGTTDWEGKINLLEIYSDLAGDNLDIPDFLHELCCDRIEFLVDGNIGKHEIVVLEEYIADNFVTTP